MELEEKKEEGPKDVFVGSKKQGHYFEIKKDKYGQGETWKEGGQEFAIKRDPYTKKAVEVEGKGAVERHPITKKIISIGGEKVYGDLEDL